MLLILEEEKKSKYFVKSLGCKTSQIEGQFIHFRLAEAGYIPTISFDEADIFIINSCSVTEHADNQALYLIKRYKALNPEGKIILTGCFAQTSASVEQTGADLILGNNEKLDILDYMKKLEEPPQKISCDILSLKTFNHKEMTHIRTTRPSIKIQEGCNNSCAYCIIPQARGFSRSDTVENIVGQINSFVEKGYKEMVLTGIHIGQWGCEWGMSLIDLLEEIEKTDILRYRLGSLYVTEITDELIDFLKDSKKFCPHFHLSLQSMTNKTLKNMNRTYTKKDEIELIEKLHKNFEFPFIGCDIITGFPNETDKDFEETFLELQKSALSAIHAFPYSGRPNTPAYNMKMQILDHVKKERAKQLIALSEELHREFLDKNRNRTMEVLFQRKAKDDKYVGITRNYIKVRKASEENLWNTVETLNLADYEIE